MLIPEEDTRARSSWLSTQLGNIQTRCQTSDAYCIGHSQPRKPRPSTEDVQPSISSGPLRVIDTTEAASGEDNPDLELLLADLIYDEGDDQQNVRNQNLLEEEATRRTKRRSVRDASPGLIIRESTETGFQPTQVTQPDATSSHTTTSISAAEDSEDPGDESRLQDHIGDCCDVTTPKALPPFGHLTANNPGEGHRERRLHSPADSGVGISSQKTAEAVSPTQQLNPPAGPKSTTTTFTHHDQQKQGRPTIGRTADVSSHTAAVSQRRQQHEKPSKYMTMLKKCTKPWRIFQSRTKEEQRSRRRSVPAPV